MDTIKPNKENPMTAGHALLANAIRSYEPDRLDENTVQSLRFMLKHEAFAPVHEVIEDKILEIADFFRKRDERYVKTNLEGKPLNKPKRGPTRDNRKRKKKQANAGDAFEVGTPGPTMEFIQDPTTKLLIPVKK